MYQFVRAAMTKYHRPDGLSNRNSFSHGSGGWKSKIRVWAGLVSPKASLRGWQMATCPQMVFPLCACTLVSLPVLIRTPVQLDPGLTL